VSAAVQPLPGRPTGAPATGRQWLRRLRFYLPAIVVFVGVIALWEVAVGALGLKVFVLPKPSAIIAALQANWTSDRFGLLPSFRATMLEALVGLAAGTLAAVIVALAASRWVLARNVLLPIAIAAGAIPIIAFAPLANTWFGLTNWFSKAFMAAVVVFFPVMANVTRGLVQVDASAIELMRSYAASEWTILRKVRIPNALPYFFTALKIATTLSLIGAIIAEYFGGQSLVLGRIMVQSASALRFDITWAAILLGAIAGIVLYLGTVLLERLVIPWHASVRPPDG